MTDRDMQAATVGQLVAEQPGRASVFTGLGIDYCCGGKITLAEACSKKGLNVNTVLEKLLQADNRSPGSSETEWSKSSLKELIDHIIASYHRPLQEELPRLTQLVHKVASRHGENHPELHQLLSVYESFAAQLQMHMQKEELVLFPGIEGMEAEGAVKKFACGGAIEHAIAMMTTEHDDAGAALADMRRLTNNYTPPADACNSYKVLFHQLAQIEKEMHQHVHKENNILFPRAQVLAEKIATSCVS